jgi:hypothetical protein
MSRHAGVEPHCLILTGNTSFIRYQIVFLAKKCSDYWAFLVLVSITRESSRPSNNNWHNFLLPVKVWGPLKAWNWCTTNNHRTITWRQHVYGRQVVEVQRFRFRKRRNAQAVDFIITTAVAPQKSNKPPTPRPPNAQYFRDTFRNCHIKI